MCSTASSHWIESMPARKPAWVNHLVEETHRNKSQMVVYQGSIHLEHKSQTSKEYVMSDVPLEQAIQWRLDWLPISLLHISKDVWMEYRPVAVNGSATKWYQGTDSLPDRIPIVGYIYRWTLLEAPYFHTTVEAMLSPYFINLNMYKISFNIKVDEFDSANPPAYNVSLYHIKTMPIYTLLEVALVGTPRRPGCILRPIDGLSKSPHKLSLKNYKVMSYMETLPNDTREF